MDLWYLNIKSWNATTELLPCSEALSILFSQARPKAMRSKINWLKPFKRKN